MSRHLFPRAHLPHPHIAQQLADAVGHALAAVHHEPRWHEPPARTTPPATDWPEWSYEREGRGR